MAEAGGGSRSKLRAWLVSPETIAVATIVGSVAGVLALFGGNGRQGEPIPSDTESKPPVEQTVPVTSNQASTLSVQSPPVVTAVPEVGQETQPEKSCPSDTYADVQGQWQTKLTCDGQDFTGRLTLQFATAKTMEATLAFDRAPSDEGDSRDPLSSGLRGDFEPDGKSVYLRTDRDPLRTGYPLVELHFNQEGLRKDRLRGRVVNVESRGSQCGLLTATRIPPSFGGRSYPTISFNRRLRKPSFDPTDC